MFVNDFLRHLLKRYLTFPLFPLDTQDLPSTLFGWVYLTIVAPTLFLLFSDTCVYWIHRALHHRLLYAPIHKLLHHKYKETTPFFVLCISSVRWMASRLSLPCFCFSIPNAPCELLLCPCYCRLVDNKYTRSNHSKVAVCQWCGTSHDPPHRFQLQLRTIFCLLGLSWGISPGPVQLCTL